MSRKSRPRDENGWRIPQDGTRAKEIYDLAKIGKSPSEICAAIPSISLVMAHIYIRGIKNPEAMNLEARHRELRRKAQNGTLSRGKDDARFFVGQRVFNCGCGFGVIEVIAIDHIRIVGDNGRIETVRRGLYGGIQLGMEPRTDTEQKIE
jgi:hypothetical protein